KLPASAPWGTGAEVARSSVSAFADASAVARSGTLSPLRSAITGERGPAPVVAQLGAPKPPAPSPSRTPARAPDPSVTARSGAPSPLRSPAAIPVPAPRPVTLTALA